MGNRSRIAEAVAAAHLLLVASWATGLLPPAMPGTGGKALRLYGALTGADNRFGYFAPEVGPELRLDLTAEAGGRPAPPVALIEARGREAELRAGTVVSTFAYQPLRREMARSLAARVFSRHPNATAVNVHVEVCELPTMAEYRAGVRPRWKTGYQARFVRAAGTNRTEETLP
jgi:hypothetical protein